MASEFPPAKPESDLSKVATGMPDPELAEKSTDALIEMMLSEGWNVRPEILRAIAYKGAEAVEPLIALVRRLLDPDANIEARDEYLERICALLAALQDPAAIPVLVELFRHPAADDVVQLSARDALMAFGERAVEPFLELLRDRTLDRNRLSFAATGATRAAGDDPVLRARVAEQLRAHLTEELARPPEAAEVIEETIDESDEDDEGEDEYDGLDLSDLGNKGDEGEIDDSDEPDDDWDEWGDQANFASILAADLADLADPLARKLIQSAFDTGRVEDWFIDAERVERLYEQGGRRTVEIDPRQGLRKFEDQYDAWGKLRDIVQMMDEIEHRRSEAEDEEEPTTAPRQPVQPFRNTTPRSGRNDPCWCGSGKKYKKCHLNQDQAEN